VGEIVAFVEVYGWALGTNSGCNGGGQLVGVDRPVDLFTGSQYIRPVQQVVAHGGAPAIVEFVANHQFQAGDQRKLCAVPCAGIRFQSQQSAG